MKFSILGMACLELEIELDEALYEKPLWNEVAA
jgi:hypothetical protein